MSPSAQAGRPGERGLSGTAACAATKADAQATLDGLSVKEQAQEFCVVSSAGKDLGCFPTQDEANAEAIGVDPVTEIRRILATRPGAIVDDYPRFAFGNRATRIQRWKPRCCVV